MNPMRENVENVFGYFCKELCLKRFPLTAIAVFERTSTFKDCDCRQWEPFEAQFFAKVAKHIFYIFPHRIHRMGPKGV